MIIELICKPFFLIIDGIIFLIPINTFNYTGLVDAINLLLKAMQFFPYDVWFVAIGNIVFWITVHLIVGLIKFIINFIPTYGGS